MNAEVPIVYCQWQHCYVCVLSIEPHAYSTLSSRCSHASWIANANVYVKNTGSWAQYLRLYVLMCMFVNNDSDAVVSRGFVEESRPLLPSSLC